MNIIRERHSCFSICMQPTDYGTRGQNMLLPAHGINKGCLCFVTGMTIHGTFNWLYPSLLFLLFLRLSCCPSCFRSILSSSLNHTHQCVMQPSYWYCEVQPNTAVSCFRHARHHVYRHTHKHTHYYNWLLFTHLYVPFYVDINEDEV